MTELDEHEGQAYWLGNWAHMPQNFPAFRAGNSKTKHWLGLRVKLVNQLHDSQVLKPRWKHGSLFWRFEACLHLKIFLVELP